MRYLILADIHSNLAALDAVLQDAGTFDKIWCLGDLVGYGPDPNECIERIREFPHICVAGNHDWGVLGKLDIMDFNESARRACLWTREQLTKSNWDYLDDLDTRLVEGDFTIVHGSPRNPIWEYLFSSHTADINFSLFETPFCLVGHTHIPTVFTKADMSRPCEINYWSDDSLSLSPTGARLIVNPGGVGQPRDGDPRASYAIWDEDAHVLEHHRVTYPIEVTQRKMEEAGLPARLIQRLSYGL